MKSMNKNFGKQKGKGQQKKTYEQKLDEMYKQQQCGQFMIFTPKIDITNILDQFDINLQTEEQKNPFANWIKYKNAPMDEVDKLWIYNDQIEEEKQISDSQSTLQMTYEQMLDQIIKQLEITTINVQQQVVIPKLVKVTKTKYLLENLKQICEQLNRKPQEVGETIGKYLGSTVVIQEDSMLFKTAVTQAQVIEALDRYANTYVKCDSCGSFKTIIIKSDDGKDFTLSCEQCKCVRHINK